jgi:hypothetical protein
MGKDFQRLFVHERIHLVIGEYVAAIATDNLLRSPPDAGGALGVYAEATRRTVAAAYEAAQAELIAKIDDLKKTWIEVDNYVQKKYDDDTVGGSEGERQKHWNVYYESAVNLTIANSKDPRIKKLTDGWKFPEPNTKEPYKFPDKY